MVDTMGPGLLSSLRRLTMYKDSRKENILDLKKCVLYWEVFLLCPLIGESFIRGPIIIDNNSLGLPITVFFGTHIGFSLGFHIITLERSTFMKFKIKPV